MHLVLVAGALSVRSPPATSAGAPAEADAPTLTQEELPVDVWTDEGARGAADVRATPPRVSARKGEDTSAAAPPAPGGRAATTTEITTAPAPGAETTAGAPPGGDDEPRDPARLAPGSEPLPAWMLGPSRAAGAARPDVDRDVAGRVLRGTLLDLEATRGLGLDLPGAGALTTAVADAVRGSDLPADCHGTFEVSLSPEGRVASLRVAASSAGAAASWSRAAERARASLSGQVLAPPAVAADGAVVSVHVRSSSALPSGSKRVATVRPICADELVEAFTREPGEESGRGPRPASPPPRRVPCVPVGAALDGDLSDLGASFQRTVHTRYGVRLRGAPRLPAAPVAPVDRRAPWMRRPPVGDPATAPARNLEVGVAAGRGDAP